MAPWYNYEVFVYSLLPLTIVITHVFVFQDHVAIQDFYFGAMENWGLITYQDSLLLYGMTDFVGNKFYSKIITHELAHMVNIS